MIRYALKCENGHSFESWFRSAGGYDALRAAGHVSCPVCGATGVDKALMTPQVRPARAAARPPQDDPQSYPQNHAQNDPRTAPPSDPSAAPRQPSGAPAGPLSAPASAREAALAELRRRVEANSEYVGLQFATEARKMHAGEAPERPIYGETRIDEARALLEEGVPVAPLPFMPARKTN